MKAFFFLISFVVLSISGYSYAVASSVEEADLLHQYLLASIDADDDFEKLVRLAEEGSAVHQHVLGTEYLYSVDHTFRNLDLAALWLKKSADQGYLRAQKALTMFYMPTFGDKPDAEKFFYWSFKAAEQGDSYSQMLVSNAYMFGEGVDKDLSEGLFWLRTSALNGEDEAQRILGVQYFEGDVVSQDYNEALRWLEKSAAQGNSDAEDSIVRMLYDGDGVKQDYDKAFRLATSYIENDPINYYPILHYILGEMYQYGRGTRQDISKAKESYRLSCNDDSKEGCNKYRELKK